MHSWRRRIRRAWAMSQASAALDDPRTEVVGGAPVGRVSQREQVVLSAVPVAVVVVVRTVQTGWVRGLATVVPLQGCDE